LTQNALLADNIRRNRPISAAARGATLAEECPCPESNVMVTRICAAAMLLLFASACASTEPEVIADLPQPSLVTQSKEQPLRIRPYTAVPSRTLPPPRVTTPPPAMFDAGEPGWTPPSGFDSRWKYIVIHHSASNKGCAGSFDRQHRVERGWDELGYHFVIGNGTETGDGQIEVGSRWRKQKHGAHCKTDDNYYNDHGIGICLVGNFEHQSPSAAQMHSLNRLVHFLQGRCSINPANITTHKDVTGRTACPGRRFDLRQVLAAVDGTIYASAP
jgi:hypothetical protein